MALREEGYTDGIAARIDHLIRTAKLNPNRASLEMGKNRQWIPQRLASLRSGTPPRDPDVREIASFLAPKLGVDPGQLRDLIYGDIDSLTVTIEFPKFAPDGGKVSVLPSSEKSNLRLIEEAA